MLNLKSVDPLFMKTEKFKEENGRATSQEKFCPSFLQIQFKNRRKI
jgi:hypothetical protein